MSNFPFVALVGRPNVGKSTLFNRIVGRRLAVVFERPGTTRDRQHADADWAGVAFTLIDTGGIEISSKALTERNDPLAEDSAGFLREIRAQAEIAIRDADVIVMVVDLTTGVTAADEQVADILRKSSKPVIVAASKGDNAKLRDSYAEFFNLGMGDVFAVSGVHGAGVGDLLDAVVAALPRQVPDPEEADETMRIAILGRPNVGKSSLLNRLIGEERAIVSPIAGTTRDAIDTEIMFFGQPVTLIDTAGIRKRGRIEHGAVEQYSVIRALKALKRCNVAILVLDATEGITAQDTHIAGYILDEMKSVVVLANKWDAVEKDAFTINEESTNIREALKFLPYVPVMFISALTGQRTGEVLPLAAKVHEERFVRLATAQVNQLIRDAVLKAPPHARAGRKLKIKYGAQVAVDPPKFVFHVNDRKLIHFSYERYLENQIRQMHPFIGTPILFSFRETKREKE